MVVEGLHTAPALAALAREAGVELPITDAVCSIIAGVSIPEVLGLLLARAVPAGEFRRSRQAAAARYTTGAAPTTRESASSTSGSNTLPAALGRGS